MVRCLLMLSAFISIAAGQNYNFSVPEFNCTVEVCRDRSLLIHYEMLLRPAVGYSSIDIVDIGFPSRDFDLYSMEASVEGQGVERIYHSEHIDIGVEVHLGSLAVPPGETRTFRLSGVNREMVFLDSETDDYASVEFTPTWFDGSMLSGVSSFRLEMIFPEGAEQQLVRHHGRPFTHSLTDDGGRVVYVWEEVRRVDSPYRVGISFPAGLVEGPLAERPKPPPISRETMMLIGTMLVFFLFTVFMAFIIYRSVRRANARKEEYLPPGLGLEGSGIRRGLTAPMAALLLEEKLDRVLVLIIYGLLRKGALRLEEGKLTKTGSPEGLRPYEDELLGIMPGKGAVPAGKVREIFVGMIADLEKKMEGFSLKDSREYYRRVIENAWKMVESDQSAEQAGKLLSDRFEWMLADGDFRKRAESLPEGRRALLPVFMHSYLGGGHTGSASGGISISRACSEIAGTIEGAAGSMVTKITSLSRSVTAATNPVPVSRSSSGSGCACACACAGCACACAGGGR